MQPYLLLLIISTAIAQDCMYSFYNQPYSRTTVLTIKGLPTNLAYNPNTKDLLFTLIDLKTLQNDDEQTKMDQYVLREGVAIKIDDIHGQAAAVDEKNDKVYIATDKGLHILNETKTNAVNLNSIHEDDIVQLFKPKHSDNLYTVKFPENEVYIVDTVRDTKTKVKAVPCAFILAVDSHDNIYYECDSKYVKVLLKDFAEPIEFAGIAKNSARALTVESHGSVILAANDGLYHLKPDSLIPTKLMNLDFVPSGIAFNEADIYLATEDTIYKFTNHRCLPKE